AAPGGAILQVGIIFIRTIRSCRKRGALRASEPWVAHRIPITSPDLSCPFLLPRAKRSEDPGPTSPPVLLRVAPHHDGPRLTALTRRVRGSRRSGAVNCVQAPDAF